VPKEAKKALPSRSSKGNIPDQVRIDKRPKVVEKRKRLGDFEGDT
jgi:IS30 family transposase